MPKDICVQETAGHTSVIAAGNRKQIYFRAVIKINFNKFTQWETGINYVRRKCKKNCWLKVNFL